MEMPSRAQRPPPIRAIKNRRSKSSRGLVVAAMGTRLVQKSAMVALGLLELDLPVGAPNLRQVGVCRVRLPVEKNKAMIW